MAMNDTIQVYNSIAQSFLNAVINFNLLNFYIFIYILNFCKKNSNVLHIVTLENVVIVYQNINYTLYTR